MKPKIFPPALFVVVSFLCVIVPAAAQTKPSLPKIHVTTSESGEGVELRDRQQSVRDLRSSLSGKKKALVIVDKEDDADITVDVIDRTTSVPKVRIGLSGPGGPARAARLRVKLTRGEADPIEFTNKNTVYEGSFGWESAAEDIAKQIEKWLAAKKDLGGLTVLLSQSASRTPPPAGLLVGLFDYGTDYASAQDVATRAVATFRTVWVPVGSPADSGDTMVELADLLVPRRSGFWRAGLVGTCAEAPYVDADGKRSGTEATVADYPWAAPAGAAVEVRTESADERVGPCLSRDIKCDVDRQVDVYWVWPEFMSAEFGQRGSCGAHPDWTPGYGVHALGEIGRRLTMAGVLGPGAEAAFKTSFENAKRREIANHPDDHGQPSCAAIAEFKPESWYIERQHGRWHAQGWSDTHRLCGYGFEFEANVDLAAVTGRVEPPLAWDTVTARVPEATDAHASPGGAWLLVETTSDLRVLNASGGAPLATISKSNRERLVMVEWATGANLARWSSEVARLRNAPGPAPRVIRPGRTRQ